MLTHCKDNFPSRRKKLTSCKDMLTSPNWSLTSYYNDLTKRKDILPPCNGI